MTIEDGEIVFGGVRIPLNSEAAYVHLEQLIPIGKQYHSAQQQLNGVQQKLDGARDQFQKAVQQMAAASQSDTRAAVAAPEKKPKEKAARRSAPAVQNPPPTPPIGLRSIDYLLRALVAANGSLPRKQMIPAAQALGWTTKAAKPSSALNTLTAAIKRYPDWITLKSDLLTLTEAGRAFVETLPPLLDTPAAIE